MKIPTLATATVSALLAASASHAALTAYEPFAGFAVGNLDTQGPGATAPAFDDPWSGSTDWKVQAAGLSYGSLQTTGGSATFTGPGNWSGGITSAFPAQTGGGGLIWGSYLLNISSVGDDGFEMKFGIEGNPGYALQTGFGNGGGTAVRLDSNGNPGQVFGANLTTGQTNLMVFAFNPTGATINGLVSGGLALLVNPTGLGGANPNLATPTLFKQAEIQGPNGTSFPNIGNVSIFARNTAGTVDEIRVGTSFADVTPIPEPSSLAVGALGLLAAAGIRRRK